ncbi:microfibril-associated glycoprotein 4-like [Engraulis encrasicolus]|uniref:microfibril-associated glycoprotein 4-like n=1 Tax=Engraulis encrasicolus TaxID=184585 RepID=UPI002FD4E553
MPDFCSHEEDGRGWTVFQRRQDGTINFYRPWQEYKDGFGNASGEYWLGLENLYQLTSRKRYQLRVDMEDFEGGFVYALYSTFYVGSEEEGYKLTVGGFTDKGAGDSLSQHSGMKFSTFDRDQDAYGGNCAELYLGGHWYAECHTSNPNGVYLWGTTTHYGIGVNWRHFKGYHYSLKTITMKIRPT